MKMSSFLKIYIGIILLLSLSTKGICQMTIVPNLTANQMVDRLVGPGVVYTNPSLTCPTNASGKFDNGTLTTITIDSGIVLTTGSAIQVNSPAAVSASNSNGTNGGDANLQNAATGSIFDLCKLEFDFVPIGDTVKFYYRFGSDEYPNYTCSNFNDIFSFFISGPGYGVPTNVALIPGTNCPVSINTVNGSTSNPCGSVTAPCAPPNNALFVNSAFSTSVVYSGLTAKLLAKAAVTPCSTYHMKFAIADVFDQILDSGVFLEANSFTSEAATISAVSSSNNIPAANPFAIEGCTGSTITISRPNAKPYAQNVSLTYAGTATIGADCNVLPNFITIPANGVSASLTINPVLDALIEGTETVKIYIYGTLCANTITDSITVNIQDYPYYNVTDNDTICLGQTKVLSAIPTPANANLTFSWAPPATLSPTTGTIVTASPTSTTTYTVTSTYPGCPTKDSTITIYVEPTPTISLTGVNISCFGFNDGSITANGNATYLPVSYTLNPGNSVQVLNPTTFSSLVSGLYTVTLTSSAGCTTTSTISLQQPPILVVNASGTTIPCVAGSATITASANGGSPSYQYAINGGTYQGSPVFSNLLTGTYTISVIDINNCTSTTTVTINQAPPLVVTPNATQIACYGGLAAVSVNVTGGNPIYQYSLNGSPFQTSNSFANLSAGIYTVVVSDASNCTESTVISIIQPSQLSVTSTSSPIDCQGGNTTVNVSALGGTPTYQYSLNNGPIQTATAFPTVYAGTYTITVSDLNNCTATTILLITEPTSMTWASFTQNMPPCNNANLGQISATASGGVPGYTYVLNPGAVSNTIGQFNNLAPGTYTVTATDLNNCSLANATTLIVSTPPVFTSINSTDEDCYNAAIGTIQASATGQGIVTYNLQPGAITNTTGDFFYLLAGTYTVTASTPNGCSATTIVTVFQPSQLQATASASPIFCAGSTSTITVSASGGTPIYQYKINGGVYQSSNSFPNLSAGIYTVEVTDLNSCNTSMIVSIVASLQIQLTSTAGTILCNGGTTTISNTVVGGTPNYQYSINGAGYQASSSFLNIAAGVYTIVVSDQNNCTGSTVLTLTDPTPVQWTTVSSTDILCNGGADGTISALANGGTGTLTYTIQPTNQNNTTGNFTNLSAASYSITVSDANGCSISTTVIITEPASLQWTGVTQTNVSCNGLADGSLSGTVTGGTGLITYTLQPTNQNNTTGNFSSLGASIYTVTGSDVNGCSTSTIITITEPAILQVSNITSTNPSCIPGNDGSLTITATGGTTNYQYNVNGGTNQASNTFTNLGSGVYTVQVIDANGCSVTSSITISAPNAPIITSAIATDASCQPGNDGTITLTATGGLAPYTYSSNGVNFQVSNVLNGLGVGSYTVQVSDAIGCSATSVVSIINVLSPSVALTNTTDATCIPGCDGTAAFLGSGGSSFVYTYSIDGINFQAGTNFSNLCAGNYIITVKDGNGCTGTSIFTINTFNGPSVISTSTQDILCNGGNNGSLSIVLSGGLGVINYTLLPSNATNTNGQFTSLTAGIYTVNASDVNGCTVSTLIQLNEPLPLQFSNLIANPSLCNGSGNGSIDVITQGGTPQVSFAIFPAATFVPPSTYIGLTGNSTYTVTATDANGCTLTSSVFVAQPQLLVINTATATDITCNGLVNGILNTSASGGTGLLTYSILPLAINNTTGVFNGLSANTYTITVTDINNCTATSLLQINEPTAITIDTILIQDETCTNTGNASIVITCSGGTGILNYTLQPTNITNTTGSFLNLSGNTYTVLVTDANGCIFTTLANVNNPLPIVYSSATSTNVLCNGGSTGTLTLSATGGTGLVYTYTLMPGAVSNASGQFLNLPIGNYTITASDVNLCTTITILTITEPPALVGTFISKTDITCYNANNGELSVSANGGTTPYIYTLQPSLTTNSTGIFNGLSANTYSVLITDSNLCTTLVPSIQIVNPLLLNYTQVTHTDITCYGGNTGSISASATGGLGTLNYAISPLNGIQITPGQFTNLSAGVYTVIVTDGNNCTATTLVSILQNPQIKIDEITYIEPICWGEANGKINIVASGGVGALSYQLNIGGPQATGYYTSLLAGGYSITIRDSLGCLLDTMYVLTQPEPVYFKALDVLPVYCIGASNGKIIVQGNGGRGGYKYYLSPGLYINTTGIFSGLHEGIYTMTIKDSAGCHFDSTIVIGPPLNPFGITTTHKNLGCYGTGVEGWAEVITSGGEPPYTYLWSTSPVQYGVRAENLYFGYYFVEVTDGSGCVAKDTVYIEPGPCCEEVFVPNAFSPNGDGNNDIFRVTSSAGIELIQFDVYDRWGNRVWSTNDFRSGWDGTYKGKTESMDTYFYVFRYRCLTDGENYIKKGDIMLMR